MQSALPVEGRTSWIAWRASAIVGDKAAAVYRVNVRIRDKEKIEGMPAGEFVEKIKGLIAEKKPAL